MNETGIFIVTAMWSSNPSFKMFIGKPQLKMALGKSRQRKEVNIKKDLYKQINLLIYMNMMMGNFKII